MSTPDNILVQFYFTVAWLARAPPVLVKIEPSVRQIEHSTRCQKRKANSVLGSNSHEAGPTHTKEKKN